ncbi:hypothetical protein J6590_074222 [Homalodisca vitripennis]|nr:hypothetical protein J6590_074222 [Homalodisca vitripennis]
MCCCEQRCAQPHYKAPLSSPACADLIDCNNDKKVGGHGLVACRLGLLLVRRRCCGYCRVTFGGCEVVTLLKRQSAADSRQSARERPTVAIGRVLSVAGPRQGRGSLPTPISAFFSPHVLLACRLMSVLPVVDHINVNGCYRYSILCLEASAAAFDLSSYSRVLWRNDRISSVSPFPAARDDLDFACGVGQRSRRRGRGGRRGVWYSREKLAAAGLLQSVATIRAQEGRDLCSRTQRSGHSALHLLITTVMSVDGAAYCACALAILQSRNPIKSPR